MVNDIDGLCGHAQLRHERVKRDDLFLFQAGLRDQIVELDAEHDLAIGAQRGGQLLRHRGEILLFVKRLPKKHAQLGVDGLRVIVAEKAEAGVNFLLEENAIGFGEARQHLNEEREEIRRLRHAPRFAHGASHPESTATPQPPGERSYALDRAIDFVCKGGSRFRHEFIPTKLSPGRSRCNAAARLLLLCIDLGFMILLPSAPSQCNLSYGPA